MLTGRSQAALARSLGVSRAALNDVLHGRRRPGAALLAGLGLDRLVEISYRKTRKGKAS